MRPRICLMLALLPASVLVSAASCANRTRPQVDLSVPADTFARADYPKMTDAALDSQAEGERIQDEREAWGKAVARKLDAACRLIRDTAVTTLACRPAKAEWE